MPRLKKDKNGLIIINGDTISVAGGLFFVKWERDGRFRLLFDYDMAVGSDDFETKKNVLGRRSCELEVVTCQS